MLRGVDLTISSGQTHAIMGPNGSGKTTLAYAIAGHPKYHVSKGSITLDGEDVLAMSVDARARAGLFLAMQYPVEVPGVSVANFLRTAITAVRGEAPKLRTFTKELRAAMDELSMDPAFAQRNLNEGFSGGEKKRHEILQLELLQPKIAILDETDSGLDIDALRVVSPASTGSARTDARRAAHHPLHPDPAVCAARLRARIHRRPDRRGRRPGAGRGAGDAGLRAIPQGRCGGMTASDQVITTAGAPALDVAAIRADFPILDRTVRAGRSLVYLDSGNTSQKPRQVIDAMAEFCEQHNANIHRATHELGEEAPRPTGRADQGGQVHPGRGRVRGGVHQERLGGHQPGRLLDRQRHGRIGVLAAATQPGDEIVITEMEHHSNIVPWQLLCERTGARLRWFNVTPDGRLDLSAGG